MAKPRSAKHTSRPVHRPPLHTPSTTRFRSRPSLFYPDGKLTIKGYVLLNVIFDAFCIFQLLFIRFTMNETRGLYFFFGLLMVGFLVVSLYDYVYDRLVPRQTELE